MGIRHDEMVERQCDTADHTENLDAGHILRWKNKLDDPGAPLSSAYETEEPFQPSDETYDRDQQLHCA